MPSDSNIYFSLTAQTHVPENTFARISCLYIFTPHRHVKYKYLNNMQMHSYIHTLTYRAGNKNLKVIRNFSVLTEKLRIIF